MEAFSPVQSSLCALQKVASLLVSFNGAHQCHNIEESLVRCSFGRFVNLFVRLQFDVWSTSHAATVLPPPSHRPGARQSKYLCLLSSWPPSLASPGSFYHNSTHVGALRTSDIGSPIDRLALTSQRNSSVFPTSNRTHRKHNVVDIIKINTVLFGSFVRCWQ